MVIKEFKQGNKAIVELSYEDISDITSLLSICKENKFKKPTDEKLIYLEMNQLFELIKHGTITELGHNNSEKIYSELYPTKDIKIEVFIYNVLDEVEKKLGLLSKWIPQWGFERGIQESFNTLREAKRSYPNVEIINGYKTNLLLNLIASLEN